LHRTAATKKGISTYFQDIQVFDVPKLSALHDFPSPFSNIVKISKEHTCRQRYNCSLVFSALLSRNISLGAGRGLKLWKLQ
jgi:hypothetical protein